MRGTARCRASGTAALSSHRARRRGRGNRTLASWIDPQGEITASERSHREPSQDGSGAFVRWKTSWIERVVQPVTRKHEERRSRSIEASTPRTRKARGRIARSTTGTSEGPASRSHDAVNNRARTTEDRMRRRSSHRPGPEAERRAVNASSTRESARTREGASGVRRASKDARVCNGSQHRRWVPVSTRCLTAVSDCTYLWPCFPGDCESIHGSVST